MVVDPVRQDSVHWYIILTLSPISVQENEFLFPPSTYDLQSAVTPVGPRKITERGGRGLHNDIDVSE